MSIGAIALTSITLDPAFKARLAALKPTGMTWNTFIPILLDHVDPEGLEADLTAALAEEEDAIRRATERMRDIDERPEMFLSHEELLASLPEDDEPPHDLTDSTVPAMRRLALDELRGFFEHTGLDPAKIAPYLRRRSQELDPTSGQG